MDDSWVGTPPHADPDGGGPATNFGCDSFATIQEGIDGVTFGGTVIVRAGNYPQTSGIHVDKPLSLQGPNFGISPNTGVRVAEAIISGTGPTVLRVSAPGITVTIQGFQFDSAGLIDSYLPGLTITLRRNICSNGISAGAFYFLNAPPSLTIDDNYLSNSNLAENDIIFVAGDWNGTTGTVATITNNVIENSPASGGMNLSNVERHDLGEPFLEPEILRHPARQQFEQHDDFGEHLRGHDESGPNQCAHLGSRSPDLHARLYRAGQHQEQPVPEQLRRCRLPRSSQRSRRRTTATTFTST